MWRRYKDGIFKTEVGPKNGKKLYTMEKTGVVLENVWYLSTADPFPLQKTRMMTQKIEFFVLFFFSIGEVQSHLNVPVSPECQYASMYICDKVKAIQQCPSNSLYWYNLVQITHVVSPGLEEHMRQCKHLEGCKRLHKCECK